MHLLLLFLFIFFSDKKTVCFKLEDTHEELPKKCVNRNTNRLNLTIVQRA